MKKNVLFTAFLLSQSFLFAEYTNYQFFENFLQKYVTEYGKVNDTNINVNKVDLDKIVARFENLKPKENWSKNEKLA